MKRILAIVLAIIMVISLCACGKNADTYCSNCGETIKITAIFCEYCGANVKENGNENSSGSTIITSTTTSSNPDTSTNTSSDSAITSEPNAVGVYHATVIDNGNQNSFTIYLNTDGTLIISRSTKAKDLKGTWNQQGTTIHCTYISDDGIAINETITLVTNGLIFDSIFFNKVG